MNDTNAAKDLREMIRILERKLGVLEDSQVACCKITMAQCHALVEIGRAGRISLNELAEILHLESSSMSRTVNNLVNAGLVKRDIDPEDRRYITITLTTNGQVSFEDIENTMNSYYSNVYSALPVDKRAQVIDSFHLLVTAMNEYECSKQ